jgi:predicted house-cleaning noncanonical NTP pyrophosphatase (MazG superfamily)
MKYRAFSQRKLWRDKAVAILEEQGSRMHWRRLDDAAFDHELRIKMIEEAHEVKQARTEDELLAELADVLEVLETLANFYGRSLDDVRSAQLKKKHVRGGFAQRMFVETAEHPEGSFGEKYCLADPQKYPEIK